MEAMRDQLPRLAAAAEAHGEAAMANGNDPVAATMFRISKAADRLFLALVDADALGLEVVLEVGT